MSVRISSRGPGPFVHDRDQAVRLAPVGIFADVVGNREAGFAQLAGQQGRGVLLVVRQLGVCVDALIGLDEVGDLAVDDGGQRLRPGRYGREAKEQAVRALCGFIGFLVGVIGRSFYLRPNVWAVSAIAAGPDTNGEVCARHCSSGCCCAPILDLCMSCGWDRRSRMMEPWRTLTGAMNAPSRQNGGSPGWLVHLQQEHQPWPRPTCRSTKGASRSPTDGSYSPRVSGRCSSGMTSIYTARSRPSSRSSSSRV
jgi:hypothetical protein